MCAEIQWLEFGEIRSQLWQNIITVYDNVIIQEYTTCRPLKSFSDSHHLTLVICDFNATGEEKEDTDYQRPRGLRSGSVPDFKII